MEKIKCSKCKQLKEFNNSNFFYGKGKNKKNRICRFCANEKAVKRKRQQRQADRLESNDRHKKRVEKNKEYLKKYKPKIYPPNEDESILITCYGCNEAKPHIFKFFNAHKHMKNGLERKCRICKNIDQLKSRNKRMENPDYAKRARKKQRAQNKKHYIENKEQYQERNRRNRERNRIRAREKYDPVKEKARHKKRWENTNYRLSKLMANRINQTIRDKNYQSWTKFVDYSVDDLIKHLESKFKPGMSWDNYGKYGWHIDHIKPISHFDCESYSDEQFKECWSLENLEPKWAFDNLSKGARFVG